jgi:hypothetical protein
VGGVLTGHVDCQRECDPGQPLRSRVMTLVPSHPWELWKLGSISRTPVCRSAASRRNVR